MDDRIKWDSVASDYQRVRTLGPNEYNQRLFAFWQEQNMLRPGMRVIDLGCGVGKYGMAIAELGCEVTLLDISEKMIGFARENMAPYQTPWKALCMDFDAADAGSEAFSGGFDFTISTFSPAVHDRATVVKMSAMTNGTCFITRFSAWEQPSRDNILRNLGLEPAPPMDKLAEDCASMMQAVSAAGFVPMTKTVSYDWCDRRSAEEQQDYMRRRYLSESSISEAELENAIRPLCDADGLFTDSVHTRVLWLWWKTGEKQ